MGPLTRVGWLFLGITVGGVLLAMVLAELLVIRLLEIITLR